MSSKIEHASQTVNSSERLLCCFDVSKDSLSLYADHSPRSGSGPDAGRIEKKIPNQTGAIEEVLAQLQGLVRETDFEGLLVLADPDSCRGYERKLLKTARRLGHNTGLISPEHVAKLKTVESNDTGKTDHKDPRVMHLIARLGKLQTARHLPERYRRLRRLTRSYDEDEKTLTAARQRIQAVIADLFPDYDKSATFTFNSTGTALMEAYQFNPYHITRAGRARFKNTMKRRVNARFSTLTHLFERAEESARYHKTDVDVALLVERLKALWVDYQRLTARRARLRTQIEAIGRELTADGELPDLSQLKGISLFNLTRLVGQTGPLEDFSSGRALLRYAGLNLRERRSGTYRGQTRLSKHVPTTVGEREAPASQDPRADDLPGPPQSLPLRTLLPPKAAGGNGLPESQGCRHAQISVHASQSSSLRRAVRPQAVQYVREPVRQSCLISQRLLSLLTRPR